MSSEVESLPIAATDSSSVDARQLALADMTKALHHLDSDPTIPPIIGAHLQMAVDALHTNIYGMATIDLD